MDHRRLDFIGSHTHTNVIKGKKVRQQDDGADNFADYSTDSNEEVTSSTDHDDYSEFPKVSEIKLNLSTQNVRTIQSSNILHSEAKDNDEPSKISTKPFKNKVSDYHENIHSSQTKKQDLSSKLQEDEHQNSTIRVNVLHSEAEDKNKQNNTKILTSLKSSKNDNTNSLRDSVTKKASPLLPKISLPLESGCHNISTSSLSPISEQSKERKNIFVINENASQALVDTSHIHTLSPAVKFIYINQTNVTQSESLADESPNEKNSSKVSTIFKGGSNHSMLRYKNSSQITRHDDYNAEIIEVMHVNERSLERLTEEQSSILSSPKPSEKNKAVLNNSAIMNSESNAEYNAEAFADKCTQNSNVPAKEKNSMQNIHIQRKIPANKIYEKLKTSRNLSKDNEIINVEINKNSASNFHSEKKSIKAKNKEKQKASETIEENQNSGNFLEEDETETTFIHKKRKEQASESHQDISLKENNNQQVCSPKKKINKKHSTDVNVPLRRSVRRKYPPLESWRNERLLYRFINGIPDVYGIDPGVNDALETLRKREKIKKVKKRPVLDAINSQTIRDPLMDPSDEEHPYRIKRIFRKTWKSW